VKLKLAEPARHQAVEIEAWWAENRPAAPSLFAQEFRDTLEYIARNPGVGTSWPTPRRPDLRRVLMPRTKHHVYFRVDVPKQVVQVLAVWGAPRGRGPRL
jgi:plasmid stabilization system protein ParE